jgi:hypothetical protein
MGLMKADDCRIAAVEEGLEFRKPFTFHGSRSVTNEEGETAHVEGTALRHVDT